MKLIGIGVLSILIVVSIFAVAQEAPKPELIRVKVIRTENAGFIAANVMATRPGEIRQYVNLNAYVANLTSEQISQISSIPGIRIEEDRVVSVQLEQSSHIINASIIHRIKKSGVNLTGRGETVCVIDTGINYHHPIFGNCTTAQMTGGTCPRVIGGYDFVNSDNDPIDDHGHGTHVAGIIASNDSTYIGAAPEVNLIVMKVLDFEGNGLTSNLDAALEWCTNNASRFNISVISMSIGVNGYVNTTYCDTDSTTTTFAIQNAVANNISVIIASGNDGLVGNSFPGCISNVTSVGATFDGSASSNCAASLVQVDNVTCFSNRGLLLSLLAPGDRIISASTTGGFVGNAGTSMATPFVAGAFAIARQFIRLQGGQIPSPQNLTNTFNGTGKRVNDTKLTNLSFSRINIQNALRAFDASGPNVELIEPSFSSIVGRNISLNATITDVSPVVNATLYGNFSGVFSANQTITDIPGNKVSFNFTQLPSGNWSWNIQACDNSSHCAFAEVNSTFVVDSLAPTISWLSENNSMLNLSGQGMKVHIVDDVSLAYCNLTLNGVYELNVSVNGTNTTLETGLSEKNDSIYSWSWVCADTIGQFNQTIPRNVIVDFTAPNLTSSSPSNTSALFHDGGIASFPKNYSSNGTIAFSAFVSDFTGYSNISLFTNESGSFTRLSANQTSSNYDTAIIIAGSLADGEYLWALEACDNLTPTHCGFTSMNYTIVVDTAAPSIGLGSDIGSGNFIFVNVSVNDSSPSVVSILLTNSSGEVMGPNTSLVWQGVSGYNFSNYSNLRDGAYQINASVNDIAGNAINLISFNNTIDTILPEISFSEGTNVNASIVANRSWIFVNVSFVESNLVALTASLWNESILVNETNISGTWVNFTGLYGEHLYRYNVSILDIAGNINQTQTNFITLDNLSPSISLSVVVSSSSATITFSESEPVNYSLAYGTSTSLGSQTSSSQFTSSISVGLSSLSSSTFYYFNISFCDRAGKCNFTSLLNFTTSSSSSGGSSGGGGGGGGSAGVSPSAPSNKQTHISKIEPGKIALLEPTIIDLAVSKVEIVARSSAQATFTFERLDEKPNDLPYPLQRINSYFAIEKSVSDASIASVFIYFEINESWLKENDIAESSIRLLRYVDIWTPLQTEFLSKNGSFLLYRATSPGLSFFAIAGEPTQIQEPKPNIFEPVEIQDSGGLRTEPLPLVPEPVVEQAKDGVRWPIIIAGFITFIAIGAIIYIWRRPKIRL